MTRSIGDLQDIVRTLKSKGVALRATDHCLAEPNRGKAGDCIGSRHGLDDIALWSKCHKIPTKSDSTSWGVSGVVRMAAIVDELKGKLAGISSRLQELRDKIAVLEHQKSAFEKVIRVCEPNFEIAPVPPDRLTAKATVPAAPSRARTMAAVCW